MPELTEQLADGIHWRVWPEYQELLFVRAGQRLNEWLDNGLAHVVKHGPHRTVYRVALPGLEVYVKHFRLAGARSWLRQWVRPSKARMEFDRALAVAARQVPTIMPLAYGEAIGFMPGDSFLITRGLENAQPLHEFIGSLIWKMTPLRQTRLRQQLAGALAELMARMHDGGIVHHDLHAGNVLIQLDKNDRPCLYLIDLHAVTATGHPLDWPASRENLIMLNRWFILHANRSDRLRFWRHYLRARPSRTQEFKEQARALETQTWQSNLNFWRHRDRRCLVTNRYYRWVRSAEAAGYAVTDLDKQTVAALLADPDEPFRRPGIRLLKDARSSTVAELELLVDGVPRPVIYKRFQVTQWSDPWAALVRWSPTLRSWVYGHGLRERCLPTPRPLLVLHRRRRGLAYEGYLLTEKIVDATELARYAADLAMLPAPQRRAVLRCRIDQIARLTRDLHACNLSHRDLKAANVLVQKIDGGHAALSYFHEPRPTDYGPLWLIDLVGIARHRHLSCRRRVQNLARLHLSFYQNALLTRTDRLRFLRVYLQWGLFGRQGWKSWWRDIERAALRKIAHNHRNGRSLA